jgi:hypothetical protein
MSAVKPSKSKVLIHWSDWASLGEESLGTHMM